MSIEAIASIIILVSAVLHAAVNAMIKVSDDGLLTRGCMNATALLFSLPFTLVVPAPSPELWLILLLAMLVHGLYPFFIVASYRYGDLSATFPVARGVSPPGVAILAVHFANQNLNLWQIAGIGLISCGIASFALERTAFATPSGRRGLLLACITGFIIACYTTIDGIGLRMAGTPFTFIVWFFVLDGVFVTSAVTLARRRTVTAFLRNHWKKGLTAGVLGVVTYGLALYALGMGAMVEIAALRETSVVFAAMIGSFLLHEPFGARRFAASLVVATGVIVMQIAK